jgi:hypothetical protein
MRDMIWAGMRARTFAGEPDDECVMERLEESEALREAVAFVLAAMVYLGGGRQGCSVGGIYKGGR